MEDENLYLVFSCEHGSWWRQSRHGYTNRLAEAGRWSRQQAFDICANAIPGTAERLGRLPELPVREADIQAMTGSYLARYPNRKEIWQ